MAASQTLAAQVAAVAVHGTGTPLGDPIEVGALGQGVGAPAAGPQPRERPLLLVSNKACFGHTEGTAGVSGEMVHSSILNQPIVVSSVQIACLAGSQTNLKRCWQSCITLLR